MSSQQENVSVSSFADGGFVTTWKTYGSPDDPNTGISGQRFGADGEKIGTEFTVNTYTRSLQMDPEVTTLADGGFMVVWETFSNPDDSTGRTLLASDVAILLY